MSGAQFVEGRCNCGAYTIKTRLPERMNICHCIDCRRWAGAFYSAHIFTQEGEYTFTGPEPRTHTVKGQDGMDMQRAWCDTCGWIDDSNNGQLLSVKFSPACRAIPMSPGSLVMQNTI
ncbi:hypothetical protein BD324DRAFT_425128 [Kockovaella imperatae]|uniref:CENP-V/GFA domain-containing protein n=1 Tax=Kockovaella imperatae TaxID=4999 RepID=A0A1Y1UHY7_9TREE|nr:hypothetical protein BD324DRAFT_425128 [Kockovaella imperatae]ORX37094.1 hypothetical protein BD324DRAFT_425128 [Kockovaella imperatae]